LKKISLKAFVFFEEHHEELSYCAKHCLVKLQIVQRVGKKFRLHDVLQRNAQNDKLETYKTSLLKTLDKAR